MDLCRVVVCSGAWCGRAMGRYTKVFLGMKACRSPNCSFLSVKLYPEVCCVLSYKLGPYERNVNNAAMLQ